MKKIAIIGKFDTSLGVADGQAVKTNIVAEELERQYGTASVTRISTYAWKKHPVSLFARCFFAVWHHQDVIFMTDAGGIKVFPLLLLTANLFADCKLHYLVVGGWLPASLEAGKLRLWLLKKLDGIYPETATMQRALEDKGLTNVSVVRNCKRLTPLSGTGLRYASEAPYKLCTFSRVMREKGIQEAVEAVCAVNARYGKTVYTLDIYGQIDPGQTEWFEGLRAGFPEFIRYCGTVPYDRSVDVLKEYFALLFPTKFYTEGIPGTIIDAYAAGIPVIASRWESFADVLDEQTCLSYAFGDKNGLLEALNIAASDPSVLNSRKPACLRRAGLYTADAVMETLFSKLSARK